MGIEARFPRSRVRIPTSEVAHVQCQFENLIIWDCAIPRYYLGAESAGLEAVMSGTGCTVPEA